MPGGKFTPCCAWNGKHFDSPADIVKELGSIFKENRAPAACQGACPANKPGWRNMYNDYSTDLEQIQIHFLDFRNSNICNMKCRSCGPLFSSSWASELGKTVILAQPKVDFASLDLSQCKRIYFAGGEPLLNVQHYELLAYLIDNKLDPMLMYSTNLSTLHYKQQYVVDLWKNFSRVQINVSIDAAGPAAEFVRSGTVWETIETNITYISNQSNIRVSFCPVISAINIWWISELFTYIDQQTNDKTRFQPVLANGVEDITIIPMQFRQPLIEHLVPYTHLHSNIARAVHMLKTVDNSHTWTAFVAKQFAMDIYRGENWFNNLPIRDELYRYIAHDVV
jgi:sulfatase maturation enzyme AslB (radical SAM superfamily)